jgi:CheY-like chemotaxis protein
VVGGEEAAQEEEAVQEEDQGTRRRQLLRTREAVIPGYRRLHNAGTTRCRQIQHTRAGDRTADRQRSGDGAQLGYTVLEAGNGREAIEIFQRHSTGIRLVILDLSMPVMNGGECLAQLRSIRADVPVLLSSGFGETEAASRFQSAGVTSFLQKPYTTQYLAELVKATLTGSGRL